MTAYLLVLREGPIRDPEAYAEYQRLNRSGPAHDGVKPTPLIVQGAMEALEGTAPDGMILLGFPTAADARAWYESPAYQAALPHRLRAADHRVILVEGFVPPG